MEDFEAFLNSDDALFHYTSASTALEKILFEKTLKFSSLNGTNDPFEYKYFGPAVFTGWGDISEECLDLTLEYYPFCENNIHFLSFCTTRNDRLGCLKPRMWAQYGSNNSGLCLVFSKERLVELVNANSTSTTFIASRNIEYKDIVKNGYWLNGNFGEEPFDSITKNHRRMLVKDNDFADEDEFRVLMIQKHVDAKELLVPIEKILVGVISGDRFTKAYEPLLKQYLDALGSACKKVGHGPDGTTIIY